MSSRLENAPAIQKKWLKNLYARPGLGLVGLLMPVLIVLLLASCGYRLRQSGNPVGLEIRSIAVPLIKSPASTLGFEGEFTKILREEFISHSSLEVLPGDRADAVLVASVRRIATRAVGYAITQNTIQGGTANYEVTNRRRIRLNVDARLVSRKSGEIIWQEKGVREETDFVVSDDPLETRYNRQLAIRTMARDAAKRFFAKTMERF